MIKAKACKKCGDTLSLDRFSKKVANRDGLSDDCRSCASIYFKEYRKKNRDKLVANSKKWHKENKEHAAKYQLEHRRNNPHARIAHAMRQRLSNALCGASKSKKTAELLCKSGSELRDYIEAQFTEGMTWDNYGYDGWHIDHIRPCISFDLTQPEEQKKCFHYTNLQPMWSKENISKSDSWSGEMHVELEMSF